jgi:transposase-like protein
MDDRASEAGAAEPQAAARGSQGRRRFTAEFREKVVEDAQQPGVSIAAVARSYDLDPNMLRRWMRSAEHKQRREAYAKTARLALQAAKRASAIDAAKPLKSLAAAQQRGAAFVPVAMSTIGAPNASAASDTIRIEFNRGSTTITVAWPVSASKDCGAWLHELMQ